MIYQTVKRSRVTEFISAACQLHAQSYIRLSDSKKIELKKKKKKERKGNYRIKSKYKKIKFMNSKHSPPFFKQKNFVGTFQEPKIS